MAFPLFLLAACSGKSDDSAVTDSGPPADAVVVNMSTSLGDIVLTINTAEAPVTAANFLRYVDEGFFDGSDGLGTTTFHRVISDFVVQGGGYTESGAAKSTHAPIELESQTGLLNVRGSVAMARTNDPNSATSQFYVNLEDNDFLDYLDEANPGYAVFGMVTDGMVVVNTIANVDTDDNDAPLKPILITSCTRD